MLRGGHPAPGHTKLGALVLPPPCRAAPCSQAPPPLLGAVHCEGGEWEPASKLPHRLLGISYPCHQGCSRSRDKVSSGPVLEHTAPQALGMHVIARPPAAARLGVYKCFSSETYILRSMVVQYKAASHSVILLRQPPEELLLRFLYSCAPYGHLHPINSTLTVGKRRDSRVFHSATHS
ncbi:hypothetical protein KIL84_020402 [Mauremys mutica]|uniref:Uncharacterized protein n=1 Tax=Mauremys mutica TaxID=74926 RepID=A0A9D3XWQ7_9SAUR|nr:hypothetical protein KIL84_020402 [Mauremys mutica]